MDYSRLTNPRFNEPTLTYPRPSPSLSLRGLKNEATLNVNILHITFSDVARIFITGIFVIISLCKLLIPLCKPLRFIKFSTNLSINPKRNVNRQESPLPHLSSVQYGLLLSENEESCYFLFLSLDINFSSNFIIPYIDLKCFPKFLCVLITLHIFHLPNAPFCDLLCLMTLQNCGYFFSSMATLPLNNTFK